MAGQIYVKLDGIAGESEDREHADFFDAESFDFGGSQNLDPGTFQSTGRVNYDTAMFTVKHDKQLATLFQYMNENKLVETVTVHWRQVVEEGDVLAIDMELRKAKVVSVHSSLEDQPGSAMNSMFTVGLIYAEYTITTASAAGDGGTTDYEVRVGRG